MYPLDRKIIPESAVAPSLVTQRPLEDMEQIQPQQQIATVMPEPGNSTNKENLPPRDYALDESEDNIPLSTLKKKLVNSIIDDIQNKTPLKGNNTGDLETTSQHTTSDSTSTLDITNEPLNKSFTDLLPTPELFSLKQKTVRKKSLNYKAQIVTKDLFSSCANQKSKYLTSKSNAKAKSTPSTSKGHVKKLSKANLPDGHSWYCYLCQTKHVLDLQRMMSLSSV